MTESTLRDTFGRFLIENGEKYKDIVVLDTDLSTSTRTNLFAKKFPERFFNIGIAEQNMLGIAIGLAISGKIPVVSGFSIFVTGRAWEFIRFACHDNLNVKIVATHSGFVGEDGSTHNALEDLSLMAILPHLNIFIPIDDIELVQMLEYAINNIGTFYIRLPRDSFPIVHDSKYKFILGKPDILKGGYDIGIIGTGYGSILGFQFAKKIEENLNISIKVINISNIKPINESALMKEIHNLKGLLVIEEHNVYCGFGSIISRIVSENIPIPMNFIGVNNSFGESGKRDLILETYGFNIQNIILKIKNLINWSKK